MNAEVISMIITHGEPLASEALRQKIRRDLGWDAEIPEFKDSVRLE